MRSNPDARRSWRAALFLVALCFGVALLGLGAGGSSARAQEAKGGTPLLLAGSAHHASRSHYRRRIRHPAPVVHKTRSEPRHVVRSRHVSRRHYIRHGRRHVEPAPPRAAATAEPPPAQEAAHQSGPATVTILTGALGTTSSRIAADLSGVLDGETLRVEPIVGTGPIADADALAKMPDVDLALVRSDAPPPKSRAGFAPTYLVRLYNAEVHVLAGPDVTDLRQLDGKRVAVGEQGSNTEASAATIFERLGIRPVPVSLDAPAALRELRAGRLAAALFVSGKPAPDLAQIPPGSGLHLLSVPYADPLQQKYFPARLTHADYPGLVPAGAGVDTVAIGTMLVANNAPRGSARYERLAAFAKDFVARFEALKGPSHHPKWREINLAAQVPGWNRFGPVRQALDAPAKALAEATGATPQAAGPAPTGVQDQATAAEREATSFDRFVASRSGGADPAHLSSSEQDLLLKEYEQWKHKRTR